MRITSKQIREALVRLLLEAPQGQLFQFLPLSTALTYEPYFTINQKITNDPDLKFAERDVASYSKVDEIFNETGELITILSRLVPNAGSSYFLQQGVVPGPGATGAAVARDIANSQAATQFQKLKDLPHFTVIDQAFNETLRSATRDNFTPGEFGEESLSSLMKIPQFRQYVSNLGWPDLGSNPILENLNAVDMPLGITSTAFPSVDNFMLNPDSFSIDPSGGHLDFSDSLLAVSAKGSANPRPTVGDNPGVVPQAHNISEENIKTVTAYVLARYLIEQGMLNNEETKPANTSMDQRRAIVARAAMENGITKVTIPVAGFNISTLAYFQPGNVDADSRFMIAALGSEIFQIRAELTGTGDINLKGSAQPAGQKSAQKQLQATGDIFNQAAGKTRDRSTFIAAKYRDAASGKRGDVPLPTSGQEKYAIPNVQDLGFRAVPGKHEAESSVSQLRAVGASKLKKARLADITSDESIVIINQPIAIIFGESLKEMVSQGGTITRLMSMPAMRNAASLNMIVDQTAKTYASLYANYGNFARAMAQMGHVDIKLNNIEKNNIATKTCLITFTTIVQKMGNLKTTINSKISSLTDEAVTEIEKEAAESGEFVVLPHIASEITAMEGMNDLIGDDISDLFDQIKTTLETTDDNLRSDQLPAAFNSIMDSLTKIAEVYNNIKKKLIMQSPIDPNKDLQLRFGAAQSTMPMKAGGDADEYSTVSDPERANTARMSDKYFQKTMANKAISRVKAGSTEDSRNPDVQTMKNLSGGSAFEKVIQPNPSSIADIAKAMAKMGIDQKQIQRMVQSKQAEGTPTIPQSRTPDFQEMTNTARKIHLFMGQIRDAFNSLIESLLQILDFIDYEQYALSADARVSARAKLNAIQKLNENKSGNDNSKILYSEYILINGLSVLFVNTIRAAAQHLLNITIEFEKIAEAALAVKTLPINSQTRDKLFKIAQKYLNKGNLKDVTGGDEVETVDVIEREPETKELSNVLEESKLYIKIIKELIKHTK